MGCYIPRSSNSSKMKSINTLIRDIYKLVSSDTEWFTDELRLKFAEDVSRRVQTSLNDKRGKKTLRISYLGDKCDNELWQSLYHPELAEPLPAPARIKY